MRLKEFKLELQKSIFWVFLCSLFRFLFLLETELSFQVILTTSLDFVQGNILQIIKESFCSSQTFAFLTQEPMDVVDLFGLKGVQHTPISIKNARVSQVSNSFSFKG